MASKKRITYTNPSAAKLAGLSKPASNFAATPETPGPITPKQIRRDQQITEGKSVTITNPAQSRKDLR
jgi:hypothetical protein